MRNVSGYLTDDGKFFQDKKEAENHEKLINMTKHITAFVAHQPDGVPENIDLIKAWEKYRAEVTK